jgi:hypothetical protein
MPRGGRRAGAGRKPKDRTGIVLGMDGSRRTVTSDLPPAITAEERASLLDPPADLSAAERKHWKRLAPLAIARDTLVPATEAGFSELCARMAQVEAFDAKVALVGWDTLDALPFQKERRSWAKDLNSSLKDFKLTAFGKPETSGKPKPAANPWGAFAPATK